MEIKILEQSKDEILVEIENLTIAEILRAYLNKDSSVTFAAWKRDHPTVRPVLKVKTKGKTAVKAIKDAVGIITKDLDKTMSEFQKLR